jgi:hypothetical protein
VRVVCIAGVWDKGRMVWRSFGFWTGRFPGISDTWAWVAWRLLGFGFPVVFERGWTGMRFLCFGRVESPLLCYC